MAKTIRRVYYFDEPGEKNTQDVLEAVAGFIEETGIDCVIVAATSGNTALRLAERLEVRQTRVFCVSEPPSRQILGDKWPCLEPAVRERLEQLGVTIIERHPYKFHSSVLELARWHFPIVEHIVGDVLGCVGGQGLKVAVEIMFMTVEGGHLEPGRDVIAVSGYGSGADTAIVVKTSFPETLFSSDVEKRLEIREILAMPRTKAWWDYDKRTCLR